MIRNKRALAAHMRANPSPPEAILWEHLKQDQLGVRFVRQHIIRGFIVDFWAPKLRLAIEVDGKQHQRPDAVAYDQRRDAIIRATGATILRIPARDVFAHPPSVLKTIRSLIQNAHRVK